MQAVFLCAGRLFSMRLEALGDERSGNLVGAGRAPATSTAQRQCGRLGGSSAVSTWKLRARVFLRGKRDGAAGAIADEAERILNLTDILAAHYPPWVPVPYVIVGLCYSPVSPTTLARHGKDLCVACRAMQSAQEWLADSWTGRHPRYGVGGLMGDGYAHAGFLSGYRDQVKFVLAGINSFTSSEQAGSGGEVILCGHSLVGAVAKLLGLAYAQAQRSAYSSRVVSFLCTRLGDKALRNFLERHSLHTHFYVRRDPIAGAPI